MIEESSFNGHATPVLRVNMLYRDETNFVPAESNETVCDPVYRVLYLDGPGGLVSVIHLFDAGALPIWIPIEVLRDGLSTGGFRVIVRDPFAKAALTPDENIPEGWRRKRDQWWASIEPLIGDPCQVLSTGQRGILVAMRSAETQVGKASLYDRLRRYWKGGQVPNALLPRFQNSGRRRDGRPHAAGDTKRGRPRDARRMETSGLGINVHEQMAKRLQQGGLLYHAKKGYPLKKAYRYTLRYFLTAGYRLGNGKNIPLPPPIKSRPSFEQFVYWYNQVRDVKRELIVAQGIVAYNQRHRPVVGSAQRSFGPGALVEIDASWAAVQLVSRFDRTRVIGYPLIYLVVDVFSWMICGLYVGFENPSWAGQMLALESAISDKVAYCARFGRKISFEDWPCCGLVAAACGDRGELLDQRADHLANALKVTVVNLPARRPDWKPFVEKSFDLIDSRGWRWLPGATWKIQGRTGRRVRPRSLFRHAVLDIYQFNQIMIEIILDHNCHHRLSAGWANGCLERHGVPMHPLDAWRWGIANREAQLRTVDPEELRLALLPRYPATVTAKGLRMPRIGLRYSSEALLQSETLVRGTNRRTSAPPILVVDPRNVEYAWAVNGRKPAELCSLISEDRRFAGLSHGEVEDIRKIEKAAEKAYDEARVDSALDVDDRVRAIVEAGEQMTKAAGGAQRPPGPRSERRREAGLEHRGESWIGPPKSPSANTSTGAGAGAGAGAGDGYVPRPTYTEQLRTAREQSSASPTDDEEVTT